MVGTLADMQNRIADEISRSDLPLEIGRAINDAIDDYQSTRFFFNETRDIIFNTNITQEWYDETDDEHIPHLLAIDYVKIYIGTPTPIPNNPYSGTVLWGLTRKEPEDLELAIPANGQPSSWTYYNQQLRVYPIPTSVWPIRIAAHVKRHAPRTVTEAGNVWMTHAERLIRCCAKKLLFLNVDDLDTEKAEPQEKLEKEALNILKGRTAKMLGRGYIRSYDTIYSRRPY